MLILYVLLNYVLKSNMERRVNMNEYDRIQEAVLDLDFSRNRLEDCGNGLFLTRYEMDVLSKYQISYQNFSTLKEVLFEVEGILNMNSDFDDLEQVSQSIAERDYYYYSNK